MFDSIAQLLEEAKTQNRPLYEIILDDEAESTAISKDLIIERLKKSLQVMKGSLERARLTEPQLPIPESMNQAKKMVSASFLLGTDLKEAVAMAMEIAEYNSGMGLIVAAPTTGSSGVLPACLFKAQQMLGKSDENVLNSLFIAAAIGGIIGNKASLSGSEAECQAEVGVAAAMAAAAITYLAGGTNDQIGQTVPLALQNLLGLACDPVAGLVIAPCIKRNAIGVANAFLVAEMALSGVCSEIPADEVIEAMMKVGRRLPVEIKETGLGGIADTPTGRKIKTRLFGTSGNGNGNGNTH